MSGETDGRRERWRRVSALLDDALERTPSERADLLARVRAADPPLADELEALLAADVDSRDFLEGGAGNRALVDEASRERQEDLVAVHRDARAGPFRLVSEIGRGGMGSVWFAVRVDGAFEQRVAVKLILAPHDERVLREFLRERQLLARLDDSRIARLIDGGVTDAGVPFLAMEFVDGVPITDWVAARDVPLARRLELFREVCAAVEAAHRAGVVHRDLKPSNVLVTWDGRVKLLDFGVARRLDAPASAHTAGPALTPAYAAPEQVRGEPSTAATDVYALGLLLYELLTGERAQRSASDSAEALVRAVLQDAPPLPSEAARRGAASGTPWRALRGDLDRIVAKAIAKEPGRRYASAAALADDVGLHLAGEPVSARASTTYRAARWARRRRVELLAAAALLTALGAMLAARRAQSTGLRASGFALFSTFPGSHRQPSFSPDGRRLAFVQEDASGVPQIFVKDLDRGEPSAVTAGAPGARVPSWTPDGDLVYSVPGRGIWRVDAHGGAPLRIVERGVHPRLSRDGRRLVYRWRAEFFVADADGSHARVIPGARLHFPFGISTPDLSPDGREIAYFQDGDAPITGDLYVARVDGGPARRLTFDDALVTDPVYTPDGRHIVFSSKRGGSLTLWAVPAAGGRPTALTTGSGEDTDAAVSPDGRRLVYANARGVNALVVLDPRTGVSRTLLEERGFVTHPSFSPDGRRLAFFREMDGRATQVFTIGRDGSGERAVTRDVRDVHALPEWSRDGRTIAFYLYHLAPAAPEPVYARAPAEGGAIEVLARDFPTHTYLGAQLDPTGRRLLYPVLDVGTVQRTVIRDLATGAEHTLGEKLAWPRWSEDGTWVVGPALGRGLMVCPADGGPCRRVAGSGGDPRCAGGFIYFARYSDPFGEGDVKTIEIRRVRDDGTSDEHVADLPGAHPVSFFFDVAADGAIAWDEYRPTRSELWTAELK